MNLNTLRIGTRLGGGFAVVLLLLATLASIAIWQLQNAADATQEMMAMPLAKERLLSEQARAVVAGLVRYKALIKSTGPDFEDIFADDIKAATLRGTEVLRLLGEMPASKDDEVLLKRIVDARNAFQAAKDAGLKARRAGNFEEASRIYDNDFVKTAPAYSAAMQAYLDHQKEVMDNTGKAIDADVQRAKQQLVAIAVVTLLIGAFFAWRLTRSITRPIASAVRLADTVARGDLSQRPVIEGSDEIAKLMTSLHGMNTSLHRLVTEVRQSADSIQTASSEVATGNLDLSNRTEQTASSLQQTASSMEQLTGVVRTSTDSAQKANQLAASAAEVATSGGAVVSEVVSTMNKINVSSKKIADIIGVIDGIAFQTNILALNAAVEAARAGEQGRGFAVVASEVRSLAGRSAQAAKEIKTLIGVSVEHVDAGSRLVADAGKTMEEIVGSVRRVSEMIGAITAATAEQSEGIGQVNSAVLQLDQMTQQNAALVEESTAAADSLKDQARRLSQVVATFHL